MTEQSKPPTARAFYHYGRSWYAKPGSLVNDAHDLVTFGEFCADGGGDGEIAMVWYPQGPRLEVFSDGWFVLAGLSDLISTLGSLPDKDRPTPAEFCDLLAALGFEDRTQTERWSRAR